MIRNEEKNNEMQEYLIYEGRNFASQRRCFMIAKNKWALIPVEDR